MKLSLSAYWLAVLFAFTSVQALAQGISEGASLWGAGGLGAGIGVAAGSKGTKQASSSAKTLTDKLNQAAAATYKQAVLKQRAGKQAESAKLMASFAGQREKIYGVSDPVVLKSYDTAAHLARQGGKKAEAQQYERKALEVCTKRFGENSEAVKQRQTQLGITPKAAEKPPATPQTESTPTGEATTPTAQSN